MKNKWFALILVVIVIVVVAMNMKITRTTVPIGSTSQQSTTSINQNGPHLEFLEVTETPNIVNLSHLQMMNSLRNFHTGTHTLYFLFQVTKFPVGKHEYVVVTDKSGSNLQGLQGSFTITKSINTYVEAVTVNDATVIPGWNRFELYVDGNLMGFTNVYAYSGS